MSSMGLRTEFSRFSGVGSGDAFPDPFFDVASLSMPSNMRSALYWCEFIMMSHGTYRMAMERVVSYFLTEIEILNASDDETEKWKDFLEQTVDAMTVIQSLLRDRMCFHGDTTAVTRDGVFRLRDLAGRTVDVLSQGGMYRPAAFRSFGRQELMEVRFSDGRTVLATPEHEWVALNCSGRPVRVPTTTLTKGYRIERTVADRPEKNEEYREGVRHGFVFVFGDGSLYNGGRQATAVMVEYFAGIGCAPLDKGDRIKINGPPPHYKQMPDNAKSASYWYGFVCGFLAADGTVDLHGCALLTQRSRAVIDAIVAQLPRIGMACGPVRSQWQTSSFTRADGRTDTWSGRTYMVTLLKRFMLPQDFLIKRHRANFEENFRPTEYGKYIRVASVQRTGIVDEVFCCVEPETHTFVVGNAILTGNCYGNAFASVMVPFKRFLVCPKCGYMAPLREVYENPAFAFRWELPHFCAACPSCKTGSGYSGAWVVKDEADDEEKKIKVKRWNPHEIELLHDQFTDDVHYLWRIPEDYKRQVRQGHLFHLERVSKQVLGAIHRNQVFRFNPDAIFHMKEPVLAGIYNRGWGIPRIISNFRQIWYVQVLRRFNEAIALDYVIPFRIITPAPRPGAAGANGIGQDPLMTYNGGDFRGQVQSMIRRRRRDPASMQILPFPVNFQMFGADANQLAPRDLLDQGTETLLNEAGTPIELYNGSLQLQTAPPALRLFESTWHHLVHDANAFLMWLVKQIGQILSWEIIESRLKRVTIADDMERLMMAAQLMMSQQLSGTTVLRDFGYDWRQEQQQLAEEAQYQSELQSRTQEEQAQAGFAQQVAKGQSAGGGGAPQGAGGGQTQGAGGGQTQGAGDPSQGGVPPMGPVSQYLGSMSPNTPQTPEDMLAVASSLATELMGQPESVKDSELRKLKIGNPVLHGAVKSKMDDMRSQARSQAGNQAVGQMQQQLQQGA